VSHRLLAAVLVVQTLILLVLVADRLVPVAHAADGMRCEIANWPDALTGSGYAALKVKVEPTTTPLPIQVQDWNTSDTVSISVRGWQTYDRVKVEH
jgi:hypothetical protein